VYCSDFISDEDAQSTLLNQLDGKPLAEPKKLRFKTGRRNHYWKNNVVAIGLSAGFLEPLESTSIHLIQQGITKLIELFPDMNSEFQVDAFDAAEYNAQMGLEYARIRDFLLLHYVANDKSDSPMWQYFRNMDIPHSLQEKLDAWMHRGYIQKYEIGAFLPPSWVAVMLGQNLHPRNVDPRVSSVDNIKIIETANMMRHQIQTGTNMAASHQVYLDQYIR
jgi:tryptophan halogenase